MSTTPFTRRRFFSGLTGLGAALALGARRGFARTIAAPAVNRPLIVTSKTNPLVREKITTAGMEALKSGGYALDAAEKATNVSERDPLDTTVGYGGDPNEEGFLQLDASIMSGRDNNSAGAVAALENIKTPCSVARLVMERTDHLFLVGKGALKFAKMHGFKEEDLLTDEARQHWLEWKENLNPRDYYLPPKKRKSVEELHDEINDLDTITLLALDANGDIAGATSTVGHHFKLVGRVGDSPIIGAGLYVDNAVGAAGATGHGEEVIKHCASFFVVEKMRDGMTPQQACDYVCRRAIDRHTGHPLFNFKLVALNKNGDYGCCSIRGRMDEKQKKIVGQGFFVHDVKGPRAEDGQALLPPLTEEELAKLPWR